jgi:hypothetical protein
LTASPHAAVERQVDVGELELRVVEQGAGPAAKRVAVRFRRVDIRPAAAPTRIVAAGWIRRSVIEVADLTSVIVRHRDPELDVQ